ncbi:hypothetical protein [Limosilactobacillus vaginalis]
MVLKESADLCRHPRRQEGEQVIANAKAMGITLEMMSTRLFN